MSTRRTLLAAAAGGIGLVLNGRTLRAAPPDPLAPWRAAATGHRDPRIAAMGWAVLAPNPHNRQPWLVELVGDDAALLHCDLDRRLPATDPFDRQITIGLGGFCELFRMAAASRGLQVEVVPFPDGEPAPRLDTRPVARLTLRPGGTPDPLFAHAAARRSAKRPFDMARPPAPAQAAAFAGVMPAGVRFGAATEPVRVAALRDLIWRAWSIEAATPAAHLETVRLMRLGRDAVAAQPDGVSVWGPGIEEPVARGELTAAAFAEPGRPGYDLMVQRYRPMLASTPAAVWLSTPGNARAEQLAAGAAWLRLNLATTASGLALHPVSQALQEFPEMAGPYAEAQAALGDGGTVQMLGRLGYLDGAVPPTPRWPAETRLRQG